MLKYIAKKVFGTEGERFLKKLRPQVDKINSLEPEYQKLSDDELRDALRNGAAKWKGDATSIPCCRMFSPAFAKHRSAPLACATTTYSCSAAWCCIPAASRK